MRVADAPLTESACVYCGNCIDVCPTGAPSFKTELDMHEAGTRNEPAQTETTGRQDDRTTGRLRYAYCGVGCGLTPHVQDNEIVKVTSPHDTR